MHAGLTSCPVGWTALKLGGSGPWVSTSFLGPSALQDLILWDSFRKIPEEAKVSSPVVQTRGLAFCPAPSSQDHELHYLMVTAARLPSAFTSPSPALFVSRRSSRARLLIGFSIPCVRKLSSILSRNLLDFLCPAVLSLQQISGWLKSLTRTRVCTCEIASSCL